MLLIALMCAGFLLCVGQGIILISMLVVLHGVRLFPLGLSNPDSSMELYNAWFCLGLFGFCQFVGFSSSVLCNSPQDSVAIPCHVPVIDEDVPVK